MILKLTIPTLAILLASCATTPYERPTVQMSAQYANATATVAPTTASGDWWVGFDDPNLNDLISAVLVHNTNLAAAVLTVQKAQLNAGLSKLDQLPSASGGLSASSSSTTTFDASLNVAYEVDIYGKLNNQTRAADWEARATAEDLAAVRLSLIGTAAEIYWNIAYIHRQISVGEENLAYSEKVRDLVEVQRRAGAVSGVEVSEAIQDVSSQVASLASLEQQLVQYRASLTVLLGGEPWDESLEPHNLPAQALPIVESGLPADLLSRRPDLRAAEMRLRESLATVDATRKSLYPALSLTAASGLSSSELSDLVRNPTGSLTAALTLPFLDYAHVRTNVKVSKVSYEIAVANFKSALLQALSDVETALSNRAQLQRQAQVRAQALDAATQAEALYAVRYRAGAVTLRVWLDARQSLRTAQLAYDNARLAQWVNQSTLYQALGGTGVAN